MLARGQVIASRYGVTPVKLDASLATMAAILNQYNCSATLPLTASALSANPSFAKKYYLQGIELAIHGLHHQDYSLLDLEMQLDHLRKACGIFLQAGIPVTGFRSPYLRWNDDTLTAVSKSGFAYDSSQALAFDVVNGTDTGSYRRALEFYCAQFEHDFPALPRLSNDLVRIPYCLPDDEALIDRLHVTDSNVIADIWLAMLDRAYQAGELFTLGLHPERVPVCQTALKAVLMKARTLSPGVWIARLDDITTWYHVLRGVNFAMRSIGDDRYFIKINTPERATILARSIEIYSDTQPWAAAYDQIFTNEFTLRCDKRPLIGLSPGTSASLQSFLRSQGYLTELNTDSQAYPIYIDRHSFNPEDEKSVLNEIERGQWPILRLSRWPEGARCGLAITGDLDAFTIWDFARRILVS